MQPNPQTHLVVGAEGMVGQTLVRQLRAAGHRVAETVFLREGINDTRIFLDLAGPVAVWECPWTVASAVLCAGITSIKACRVDPSGTARVNVEGIVTLAGNLAERGAFVVFLSTNQVFDGSTPCRRPTEPCSPQTEYGRQKAEAEKRLLALGRQVAVVRFTKLVTPELPLFANWIRSLRNGESIEAFFDMRLAPVPLAFAVRVLERMVETRSPGIWQVSGSEDITYEQAARRLAMRLGVDARLVQSVSANGKGIPASCNPRHTTLDVERLRTDLRMEPPDAWTTIDELVTG